MLNKSLIEFELGPIVSIHKRTLTYRMIAVFVCAFLLLIAIGLNQPFGVKEGLACGLGALVFLGLAFWFESKELVVCKLGIAIGRKHKFKTIKYDLIKKLSIMYSLTKKPEAIYNVIVTTETGSQISFDMNWTNRKILLATIKNLQAIDTIECFSLIN